MQIHVHLAYPLQWVTLCQASIKELRKPAKGLPCGRPVAMQQCRIIYLACSSGKRARDCSTHSRHREETLTSSRGIFEHAGAYHAQGFPYERAYRVVCRVRGRDTRSFFSFYHSQEGTARSPARARLYTGIRETDCVHHPVHANLSRQLICRTVMVFYKALS